MKLFHAKMKVNTCTVFEIGLFTEEDKEEDEGEIGVLANYVTYVIVAVYFAYFESFIVYRNTRRPRYVSKEAYNCSVREL